MSRRHRGRKPNIAGEDPAQSGGAPSPEGERARDWDLQRIQSEYGLSRAMVRKYFPKPRQISRRNRAGQPRSFLVWTAAQVEEGLASGPVSEFLEEERRRVEEQKSLREIRELLSQYSPDHYIDYGQHLYRQFVLHVGPTNSGKTFDAIQYLKGHTPGTYLGPLRLLALEMFDKLNDAGVPCSMLTGEESIPVDGARVVSSTIELCDFRTHFRCAVIDEAQLIADKSRGAAWLKAICMVNADVVHICMAPEALHYIESLVKNFSSDYQVVWHHRLAPLRYGGVCRGYQDLRPEDALICFSRKSVLSTAALLEKEGFRASVIYGALPPAARRHEVQKFLDGETNIVVATDAIGLGISLPIKRIVFAETEKFDGVQFRQINTAELNQIAGRAGRYGLNEYGEVLGWGANAQLVELSLGQKARDIRFACLAFPREVLDSDYPLRLLLKAWQTMAAERRSGFIREDVGEALTLLAALRDLPERESRRELVYDLITCPVDVRNPELVRYWASCARAILRGRRVPEPNFGDWDLAACELQYKAYDVRHQLMRRIGVPYDCRAQREAICQRFAELMREDKEQYIRRCKYCGKELPVGSLFNVCDACYRRGSEK